MLSPVNQSRNCQNGQGTRKLRDSAPLSELSLNTKVVTTFWGRLFWPILLSFLRWPSLWEDSF
jgi:hypothetical protein